MSHELNRRDLILATAGTFAWHVSGDTRSSVRAESPVDSEEAGQSGPTSSPGEAFQYCLNTSTIRGQQLTVPEQVDVAAAAGYQAIEPWIRDLQEYSRTGGSLPDLRKRIEDAGLLVPSAIGFATWIVDDEVERRKGLEVARADMQMLKEIGGTRIASPPVGATQQNDLDLFAAAERYRALLEIGREEQVLPQLELWGFSQTLSRLGELALVASEAGHPDACLLPDVYHIYKGGSDFHGLRILNGRTIHVFHMNDYPAQPDRSAISDRDRVYPGDGIAPLSQILHTLYESGSRPMLSLELFNPTYWEQDAQEVARTGLEKMKQSVAAAFDGVT
jgi:2-keto-myo-inositol isomerase